jgi:hypothetical protein
MEDFSKFVCIMDIMGPRISTKTDGQYKTMEPLPSQLD